MNTYFVIFECDFFSSLASDLTHFYNIDVYQANYSFIST